MTLDVLLDLHNRILSNLLREESGDGESRESFEMGALKNSKHQRYADMDAMEIPLED